MIVDLKLNRHPIVFIGKGHEFREKIHIFSREASIIYAFGDDTIDLPNVVRISHNFEDGIGKVKDVKPMMTFISTEDEELDRNIAESVSSYSGMVYVPDKVHLSDVNLCAIIQEGPIYIGISTKGKSPATTVMIKRKLKAYIKKFSIITEEDAMVVDFISKNRQMIISKIPDKRRRRLLMYRIAVNLEIRSMITHGDGNPAFFIRELMEGDEFEEILHHRGGSRRSEPLDDSCNESHS